MTSPIFGSRNDEGAEQDSVGAIGTRSGRVLLSWEPPSAGRPSVGSSPCPARVGRLGHECPGRTVATMATDPQDTDHGGLKASRPVDLDAYRVAVSELTAEVDLKSGPGSESDIEALLTARTAEAEFHPVLECAPDGKSAALAQLLSEVRQYRPNDRSSASDVSGLVRIYLLSQIDAMWWSGADTFETDQDVVGSADLVSMEALRRRGLLHFKYRLQPRGLMGRLRDWAFRRLMPRRQPHTAGIRFTHARPELIALLNQLALEFAAAVPPGTPALWVTSATRSVEHQLHLRQLGYAAMIPS